MVSFGRWLSCSETVFPVRSALLRCFPCCTGLLSRKFGCVFKIEENVAEKRDKQGKMNACRLEFGLPERSVTDAEIYHSNNRCRCCFG